MTPKKIIKKTKTYAELIDAISALEEKYDDNKPPDTAVFKRRITTFLRKHGGKK
jgi:hypothetical protein